MTIRTEAIFFAVVLGALTVLKVVGLSRLFLLWFFALQTALTLALRVSLRLSTRLGRAGTSVVIIGAGKRGQMVLERLVNHRELGATIVGFLDDDPALDGQGIGRARVIGTLGQLAEIIHRHVVDEVFIALPPDRVEEVRQLAAVAENEGKTVHIVADIVRPRFGQAYVVDFMGLPLLTVISTPHATLALLLKAAEDYLIAVVALIVALPLMGLVALAIKLESSGPVFFMQTRVGLHGRLFSLYKFRSMVQDAEHLRSELAPRNEADGPVFKIKADPRITRVGRWLRKTSIDELPQLVNVLKGQMSLVGPRPALPDEVAQYSPWQRRRLSMKPGITGLWQVSGRNDLPFSEWVRLDLDYIDHWSLAADIDILLRTIPAAFKGM